MNSIFLLRYRRNVNATQQMVPVYAESVGSAWGLLLARKSQELGADVDGLRLLGHREIPERGINLRNRWHQDILNQLSPEDRIAFYEDRRASQERANGHASPSVEKFFSQNEKELV